MGDCSCLPFWTLSWWRNSGLVEKSNPWEPPGYLVPKFPLQVPQVTPQHTHVSWVVWQPRTGADQLKDSGQAIANRAVTVGFMIPHIMPLSPSCVVNAGVFVFTPEHVATYNILHNAIFFILFGEDPLTKKLC